MPHTNPAPRAALLLVLAGALARCVSPTGDADATLAPDAGNDASDVLALDWPQPPPADARGLRVVVVDSDAALPDAPLDAPLSDVVAPDAPPDAPAADVSAPRDAPSTYRLHPGETTAVPSHGAGGGTAFTVACPPDTVSVGVAGYADTSVNSLTIRCCALNADGTVANAVMTVMPLPGARTGTFFQDRCPANNTVVGWDISADTAVRQFVLQCAPVTDQVVGTAHPVAQMAHGTATATPAIERCPAGYVVTALAGSGDGPLTSVRGTCTRVGD